MKDPNYHLQVHQDMMNLASKHKSLALGAADYYRAPKEKDAARVEHLYNTTILPILKKHKYPERFSEGMHKVQKEVIDHWHSVKEEAPTNSAGTGSTIAGLDNNPPGLLAADKKKKIKSFKIFAREK